MDVGGLDADIFEMLRKVLGHTLREGRDEHALLFGDALVDFFNEVVNLVVSWAYFDFWIEEAGWANDLLGRLRTMT